MARALALLMLGFAGHAPLHAMRQVEPRTWATSKGPSGSAAEEYEPAAASASSERSPVVAVTPWWAASTPGARPSGMSRRIRYTLQRRLGLTPPLLDLVLPKLPINFHLVAALVHTPRGWLVLVWELAVSPDGRMPGLHAELVSKLRLNLPEWVMASPDPPRFVPGSETLVTNIPLGNAKEAVFWDARSGRSLLSVARAEMVAVSRGGRAAVGTTVLGDYTLHHGVWNARSGVCVSRAARPHEAQYWCSDAAFSPDGRIAAVLLEAAVIDIGDTLWSVALFNSSSGEKLCDFPAPIDVDGVLAALPAAASFAFDGERVVMCHGSGHAALRLDVRWELGHCRLVQKASLQPCDAVFLPGRLRLEIAADKGQARVLRMSEGSVDDLLHEVAIDGLGGRVLGSFSPDGRKAFVCCSGRCHIWAFADGRPPQRLEQIAWDLVFTDDSSALLGIAENTSEAVCFDLDGRLALRLGGDVDEVTGLATGEVTNW